MSTAGDLVLLPGADQSITMLSGGAIISTGIGTDQLGSGVSILGGTADRLVVSSGGIDYVMAGGSTISTTVDDGGTEYVFAGGSASLTVVSAGGFEFVSGGRRSAPPSAAATRRSSKPAGRPVSRR